MKRKTVGLRMAKSLFAVMLLNVGMCMCLVKGQSAVGDCSNDEQSKCYSDALFAMASNIQSEFQSLRAQISRLEDRVERQKPSGHRCPPGFDDSYAGYGKCYAVIGQKRNWEDSRRRCRDLNSNAHLAVITGESENQHINRILQNHNCNVTFRGPPGWERWNYTFDAYWVSGQLRIISSCNSTFVWKPIEGVTQPMRYSNWPSDEPNCAFEDGAKKEACLALNKYTHSQSKWNDMLCTWPLCSICEVRADTIIN
jgi:hypothetical protein